MSLVNELIAFIDNSPCAFYCVNNLSDELLEKGFEELKENEVFNIQKNKNYFIKRNDSSLIAFKVGNIESNYKFNIVASHSDSPCFKVKPKCDVLQSKYNKVLVERYGGFIYSSWLDRPLSFAGRVILKSGNGYETRFVNIKKPCAVIPNVCVHFNRLVNEGYKYNPAVDMIPFVSQEIEGEVFYSLISEELGCNKEDILSFDLYLYNAEKGLIWGNNNEFISSSRLDNLECAFTSFKSFIDSSNNNSINVYAVFDNEEVGSSTYQGADSDFLSNILKRINNSLGYNEETYYCALSSSLLISADNAHAVHPNHPELTDSENNAYLNNGIVIKYNASQSYTTDSISSAIFKMICNNKNIPYQEFTNRADIRGGSTLGNISIRHASIKSIDIGLAQLAMHSSYETAGSKDIEYLYKALIEYYSK